ncbi:MAG: glycerophosphodiester phosphodiesterase family protein [Pseudomonadota bacterium]
MLPPLPRLIGHRGVAAHAPENTLAGIRWAHSAGLKMIEFDAKLTGDDEAILMHDDTLDRTTDGRGKVRDLSLAELKKRDAGGWFGPSFAGERIPTLGEALALCGELGIAVNIEIKPCRGRAKHTAARVLQVAAEHWQPDWPLPLVSSFDTDCLIVAREKMPNWPRGFLLETRPIDWHDLLSVIQPATLNVGDTHWSASDWADYRATHLPIIVYTVNDGDRARRLIDQGAAALITDDPALLAPALGIRLN